MNMSIFRAYNVWPDFPSISLSGQGCALDCAHCGGVYLNDMEAANTPEALVELCRRHTERGARGVLISGGCDKEGKLLNLESYLPALEKVHEMGLIIKLHTGFVDRELAGRIARTGIDIASQEMVGDAGTVRNIFGIGAEPEHYLATFQNLQDAGVPHICPHVCVGLDEGQLKGEFAAIDMLANDIKISTLAIIVLRPTKGTKLSGIAPPTGDDVEKVVRHAKERLPESKIILGALRPRGSEPSGGKGRRLDIEMGALRAGIDGAEVPSQEMIDAAISMGHSIRRIQAFGVLPVEYEERVRQE